MKLSFDKFEKYEVPQVTLCNPNSRATDVDGKILISDTVGVLDNPSGMNLKLNFNAPHELSFDYYRHKSDDPIKQSFYDNVYNSVQTDRCVYLTDIGYFTITGITDSDENNIDKNSVTCRSCEENELSTAEGLYLAEGTYYLHTDNDDGLLDLFLPKTAGWTLGFIDSALLENPRYVEDTEIDNGYNFLYTTIQDMFECIVEPDIIHRKISVYSREYYAEHHLTDIHIAKYNLLKYKTVEENGEDKYTALNVQGKDENLEIRPANPSGTNTIYNFESRYQWMSTDLQEAVEKWQEKCEAVIEDCSEYVPSSLGFTGGYIDLQEEYYDEKQDLFDEEENINVLNGQMKQLVVTRDLIVSGDYDQEQYETQQQALDAVNVEIFNKQTEINTANASYSAHKTLVATNYEYPISQINSDCALDITAKDIHGQTIFTQELLNELMTHIKPTDYVDEYMLVTESMTYPQRFEKAKELMDRAKSQLVKISSGQKTYSIDTRSFLFNKQFRHFSEQLCAGAIIYVEIKNDVMEQLHLTGIDINYDEQSTSFTLGNKYDRSDLKALYEEALGQNSKSFTELKYVSELVNQHQKQLDYQKNWPAELRQLTLDNVLTSEDQAIEINNRGLMGRKRQLNADGSWKSDENGNPLFEDEQVKLINNCLIFTDDNWERAKTAVGKVAVGHNPDGTVKYLYGINGEVLIGELILGNNLVLTGTGAGIKIKDDQGNDVFYADDDGNLVLSGTIFANNGQIGGWDINSNNISYNNGDLYIGTTNGATITVDGAQKSVSFKLGDNFGIDTTGKLYAKSGTIGSWDINANSLSYGNGALYIGTTNGASITAGGGTQPVSFKLGNNFGVNTSGSLWAKDANITGAITATGGSIGGWNIGSSLNYQELNSDGTSKLWIALSGNLSAANSKPLDIHYTPKSGTPAWFYVTKEGLVHADNVDIKGAITATSGSFTNCTIKNGCKIGDSNALIINRNISISSIGTIDGIQDVSGQTGMGVITPSNAVMYAGTGSQFSCMFLTNANIEMRFKNAGLSDILSFYIGNHTSGSSNRFYISPSAYGINIGNSAKNNDLIGTWYANGSIINGSDRNIKNSIISLPEQYDILFDQLNPILYKYNQGVSKRYHQGFIAQDVYEGLQIANIDINDFAALCRETPNSGIWGIRYEEFIPLNTWQIQRCKKRIADLESTVAELKTQIQTLTAG